MKRWHVYAGQLWRLTVCEWKLREQSTLLGFLWTLLHPLLMFAVLYGLFTKWMGHHTPDYASYLLIGIVEWGFFASATSYGLTSLSRRSGIVLNFRVPRDILVLSAVLSVAISYLCELALMLAFVAAVGAKPSIAWAAVPGLVALQLALVCGVALLLAVLAARHPDVERVWTIFLTAGFFLTPIFYTLDTIAADRRRLLALNPMTQIIELTRGCVMLGHAPPARSMALLALAAATACAAGYGFFRAYRDRIGDWVAV